MEVAAIVVTYNPPAGFLDSLDIWLSQVHRLLIVDNGSAPEWRETVCQTIQDKYANVEFLSNVDNIGIGAALNRGFARLMEDGRKFVFVFDQDSHPALGMVAEVIRIYEEFPHRSKIAIVAPNVDIPLAAATASFLVPRTHFLFKRARCADQQALADVSIVISSGALYDLDAYRQIGPFREDFFIDYVDTEYCLRARRYGYGIEVACQARLSHELGDQRERRLGPITMHPTFHSPLRWYYMSRNRIRMVGLYALRFPYWFLYEALLGFYGLVRLVLFEDRKRSKWMAMTFGTLDGVLNRMGPVSRTRRSWLVTDDSGG